MAASWTGSAEQAKLFHLLDAYETATVNMKRSSALPGGSFLYAEDTLYADTMYLLGLAVGVVEFWKANPGSIDRDYPQACLNLAGCAAVPDPVAYNPTLPLNKKWTNSKKGAYRKIYCLRNAFSHGNYQLPRQLPAW